MVEKRLFAVSLWPAHV